MNLAFAFYYFFSVLDVRFDFATDVSDVLFYVWGDRFYNFFDFLWADQGGYVAGGRAGRKRGGDWGGVWRTFASGCC